MSESEKKPQKKGRGQKASADNQQKKLDTLADDAAFLDKEIAEAALHNHPKLGISNAEPELEIGKRIEASRRELKLTQGELSELTKQADNEGLGISRAVISMYEVGKNRPSPRELRMLSEALRVSPSFLIYGDDDPFGNLTEWGRFGGFSQSDPEFSALFLYAFNQLHHHHKIATMQLIIGLIRGWNKGWYEDKSDEANLYLIELGESLKKVIKDRGD